MNFEGARCKPLDSVLGRVDNRLAYGIIEKAFELAAHYAAAVARGRCFNDTNKRTAFCSLYAVLALSSIELRSRPMRRLTALSKWLSAQANDET